MRGNAPVAPCYGDLVRCVGQLGPEVPVALGAAHIRAWVPLHGVIEVGELQRVSQEEHRRFVADHVRVAFLGVEVDRASADVALSVGGAPPRSPATVEKRVKTSVFLPTLAKIAAL